MPGTMAWEGAFELWLVYLEEVERAQTGHRSGCAHAEVFRKPGTTMFWRLVYDLLPRGEWWDTIPATVVS